MYGRILLLAFVTASILVPLGAWVRLTDAGLGCPDWPGCYGRLLVSPEQAAIGAPDPATQDEHGRAWREMAHRYVAGALGFMILAVTALSWWRQELKRERVITTVLLVTVVAQAVLGMLTVTQLLHPVVVTAHLLGGMTTLSLLWLLVLRNRAWLQLSNSFRGVVPKRLAAAAAVVVACQVFLGGWTSTNYAALACVDFPTCQGQWMPQMDLREGFTVWRDLGINYEYGVLDGPARVGIHMVHRLGALVTTLMLLTLIVALLRVGERTANVVATGLAATLVLQVSLGVGNVLMSLPLPVAVGHNAGAAALLLAALTAVRTTWVVRSPQRHRETKLAVNIGVATS